MLKMEEKEKKGYEENNNQAWQALQKVKEAEERARLLVEEARQKTFPEIIRKAGEEAEEIKKKILGEARQQAEKIKKETIARAEAEAAEIKRQTEAEKQALLKRAQENFDEAVRKSSEKLRQKLSSREG
jgi:vacuolar-type H+-ATPase subunit H